MKNWFSYLCLVLGIMVTFMSCSEDENDHIVYGVGAIALDKTEVTLTVGGTPVELEATLLPDNVTHKDVVMWTTSDSTVAIVSGDVEVRTVVEEPSEDDEASQDENPSYSQGKSFGQPITRILVIPIGIVKPVGPGTATITATAESKTATCTVTVNPIQ